MRLSLDLIMESLSEFGVQTNITDKKAYEFSGVQMLTPDAEGLSDDILYICEPKVLTRIKKNLYENHCFLLRATPGAFNCKHRINFIAVGENASLNDVTNRLINLFQRFSDYVLRIKDASLSRKGIEPFIGIAVAELPHCLIVITDAAYNIISSSKKSVGSSEYLDSLLSRGYYNKIDLELMAEHGYLEDERKYDRPVLYPASKTISGFDFLVRSYKANGSAVSFMGCYFISKAPTLEDITLFEILSAELDFYYKSNGFYDEWLPNYQQLIDDIIKQKDNDPAFYRDRCFRLHIPFHGDFRIGVIKPEINNNIKASQIANQMKAFNFVSNYGIFQYGSSVIILFRDWHCYNTKEAFRFEENWLKFMNTLKSNQAYIGISLVFTSILKFSVAYEQAMHASEIGFAKDPNRKTYFYSEYYLDDILKKYSEAFDLDDVYVHYLDKLYDENNRMCSSMKLLYHYLCAERNISKTAKTVHMHRNSVIYRVQKIQETLGLDLEDPTVRTRLMISFKILEIHKKIPSFDYYRTERILSIE